jgi:hypothetical protein
MRERALSHKFCSNSKRGLHADTRTTLFPVYCVTCKLFICKLLLAGFCMSVPEVAPIVGLAPLVPCTRSWGCGRDPDPWNKLDLLRCCSQGLPRRVAGSRLVQVLV